MAAIRPIEHQDLPAVSDLVRLNLPGWSRDPAFLARTLLDHPWTPEQSPSLVAVDGDGEVIGSIGAQRRRLRFGDRELAGTVVSHFVVDPERRGGAAGALMIRKLLSGPQDLTFTDSGTEAVVRIWRTFGGHLDHSRTFDWLLAFRPGRWLRQVAARAVRARGAPPRSVLPVAGIPFHAAGRRLVAQAFPDPPPGVGGEDAGVEDVAAQLEELTAGTRLRVDYDLSALGHAFEHIENASPAPVVRRIVRRGDAALGWYAYVARPALGRVICVAARPREVDAVVAELIADAGRRGVAALSGRFEPHLDEPLRRRFAILGFGQLPIVHARDPELRATLASSRSLLTELDLIDTVWW